MSKGIRYPRRVEGPFKVADTARFFAAFLRKHYGPDEIVPMDVRENMAGLIEDLADMIEILARENIGNTYKSD